MPTKKYSELLLETSLDKTSKDTLSYSKETSPDIYGSRGIRYSSLVNSLEIDLENTLYNSDGVVTGDRDISNAFKMGFSGAGNVGVGLTPIAMGSERFQVDGVTKSTQIKVGTPNFLTAAIKNELAERTRIGEGLHIGDSVNANANNVPLAVGLGGPDDSYFRANLDFGNNGVVLSCTPGSFASLAYRPITVVTNEFIFSSQVNSVTIGNSSTPPSPEQLNVSGYIQLFNINVEPNVGGGAAGTIKIILNGTEYRLRVWLP